MPAREASTALLVGRSLGHGRYGAGYTNPVGAHGDCHQLAVLIKNLETEGLRVLLAQLKDVAHLDASRQPKRAAAVRCRIAIPNLRGLDRAIRVKSRPHTRSKTW